MNPQDAQRRPMTADEAREWLNSPEAQAARAAAEARKAKQHAEQQERGRQWLDAWNAFNNQVKQYNEEHAND